MGTKMGRSMGVVVRNFMWVRVKSSMGMKMSFMRMKMGRSVRMGLGSSEDEDEELHEDEDELQSSPSVWIQDSPGLLLPCPTDPIRFPLGAPSGCSDLSLLASPAPPAWCQVLPAPVNPLSPCETPEPP